MRIKDKKGNWPFAHDSSVAIAHPNCVADFTSFTSLATSHTPKPLSKNV